jgi:hypothetical protein
VVVANSLDAPAVMLDKKEGFAAVAAGPPKMGLAAAANPGMGFIPPNNVAISLLKLGILWSVLYESRSLTVFRR